MSGSYSSPLPLVYLEFRYLSQTKHLCFLHSWGNRSFLLEAVTSTNESNKSLQGWQIQGQSRITHTGETSLSFSLCLSALSSRAAGEGRCWSPLSGGQQQKQGNEVKLNQGKFRLDIGESSSLGGWLVTGTGCPGISLAPGHGTKPARVQGALGLLWMTLTGTGISVRYSSKDQGIALCDPSGSLSTPDSE